MTAGFALYCTVVYCAVPYCPDCTVAGTSADRQDAGWLASDGAVLVHAGVGAVDSWFCARLLLLSLHTVA